MFDMLGDLFAVVCGQNPDHTWSPGGVLLPCCQRCTGLYAGACVAALLHLWLKPKFSNRFLLVHGAFLLLMAPFGFHWLPQGPVLRTMTGVLFGFGVVTFLWLQPAARWARWTGWCGTAFANGGLEPGLKGRAGGSSTLAVLSYGVAVTATLALLPVLAGCGGRGAACALAVLVFGGLAVLAVLVVANVVPGLVEMVGIVRRSARLRVAP